jgi:hypothetical protein
VQFEMRKFEPLRAETLILRCRGSESWLGVLATSYSEMQRCGDSNPLASSSQFAGMMWRPCRAYSGQDAWALAWCPAWPRRRHDIMAPRSGFQSRPSLAVENSAPSAPARRPDARAARRAAWRHLSRDPGIVKKASAPCARGGTSSWPKRSAAPSAICARPRALLAAKSGGKHGSI